MKHSPINKKTRAEAPVKALDPAGETGRSSEGERWARISGGLLVAGLVSKDAGVRQAQVHQARIWDSLGAPLRYGLAGHIKQLGKRSVAA